MATRFVTATGSTTDAVNQVEDLANQNGETAYLARTAGALTMTAAQMINGVINQSGTPGAFNLTTDTAAAIVAAIKNAQAGSSFDFVFMNGGDGTVTVVAGTGVTLAGVTAVPTVKTQLYKGIVTVATAGSEAVTLVGLLRAPI